MVWLSPELVLDILINWLIITLASEPEITKVFEHELLVVNRTQFCGAFNKYSFTQKIFFLFSLFYIILGVRFVVKKKKKNILKL